MVHASISTQVSERETAALERYIAVQQPVSTRILLYWFPSPFLVTVSTLLLALGFTALVLMWKVMLSTAPTNVTTSHSMVQPCLQGACSMALSRGGSHTRR
jgi:hypothetical protein